MSYNTSYAVPQYIDMRSGSHHTGLSEEAQRNLPLKLLGKHELKKAHFGVAKVEDHFHFIK